LRRRKYNLISFDDKYILYKNIWQNNSEHYRYPIINKEQKTIELNNKRIPTIPNNTKARAKIPQYNLALKERRA
jgi:hypothetical protein